MIKSYLSVAVHNLLRNPLYSLLNLIGLSVALGALVLIGAFVRQELSYDQGHPHVNRIYRVLRTYGDGGTSNTEEGVSGAMVPEMRASFPEVEACLRWVPRDVWVRSGNRVVRQIMVQTEAPAFEFFDIPIVKGSAEAFYSTGRGVYVTESMASQLFGDQDPIGMALTVEGTPYAGDYVVGGILKDAPKNSSLVYDFLLSEAGAVNIHRSYWRWIRSGTSPVQVFVRLREGEKASNTTEKLHDALSRNIDSELAGQSQYHLQPFNRIYLHSRSDYGIEIQTYREGWTKLGDIRLIRNALVVAALMLLIAGINFASLSSTQALTRTKEVGVRKTVGARRSQIVYQFLGEALLLSFLAALVGLLIAELAKPFFGKLVQVNLAVRLTQDPGLMIGVAAAATATGILSAIYPSVILSSFSATSAISASKTRSGSTIRQFFVISQFAASAGLIVGTIVIYQQIGYIQTKDLGFHREHRVTVPIFWEARRDPNHGRGGIDLKVRFQEVKEAFLAHPSVLEAGVSTYHVQEHVAYEEIVPEGWDSPWRVRLFPTDDTFLEALGVPIVKGRGFSKLYASLYDRRRRKDGIGEQFLINEAAARALGWDESVGKQLKWHDSSEKAGTIIGVVKDFHIQTLHTPIEPVVFNVSQRNLNMVLLRIQGDHVQGTITHLEAVWNRFLPTRPFIFEFLDQRIDGYYRAERNQIRIFQTFAVLAILVSCLGLFGLSSYVARLRRKEMGIRKSLGASTQRLVGMMSWEFVRLALIANAIALPVAWWTMRSWLDEFAYRLDLTAGPFIACGFITVLIALITVSSQTWRAGSVDPVEGLRLE